MSAPTEPGFYWCRLYHFGDYTSPGWRWAPVEVYRTHGSSDDATLRMCDGHPIDDGLIWGPRLEAPPEPVADQELPS